MDKIKEFWKHNINPITGHAYDREKDTRNIEASHQRYLNKWGFSHKEESFDAEYIFFE